MTTGNLTIDLGTIITSLLGALILWFLKENTSEKKELKQASQNLREEVLILKTQIEPIKNAIHQVPVISATQEKMKKDLDEYFKEIKKIRSVLGDKGIDF